MKTSFPKNIQNYTEYTQNIIDHFHTPTRALFQESLASLETLIKENPEIQELKELHKCVDVFSQSMESHLQKEETILFPLIQRIETTIDLTYKQVLLRPIARMEEEHDEHSSHITPLLHYISLLQNMPVENVCDTLTKLTQLIELTEEHIYVENEQLFKQIKEK